MIRAFQKQDTDFIIQIWLDTSALAHDFIPFSYWTSKAEDMRNIYIPQSETFIYENDNTREILGFISLVDHYIAALFITPTCQNKGLGHKLMNHAKSLKTKLTLQVYTENTRSVSFYQKQGFTITGQQTDKDTGHEEFVMEYCKQEK